MALFQLNRVPTLAPSVSNRSVEPVVTVPRARRCRSAGDHPIPEIRWTVLDAAREIAVPENAPGLIAPFQPREIDPLYWVACQIEWWNSEEPSAGCELLAAAQSSH